VQTVPTEQAASKTGRRKAAADQNDAAPKRGRRKLTIA
jgi:hypothetical protein